MHAEGLVVYSHSLLGAADGMVTCRSELNDQGLQLQPRQAALAPLLLRTLGTVLVKITVSESIYRQPRPRCELLAPSTVWDNVRMVYYAAHMN